MYLVDFICCEYGESPFKYFNYSNHYNHHFHHQPINVPTAGAQAFLMDYTKGERAITHHAGPVWVGGC
jgi:hypothetical protein